MDKGKGRGRPVLEEERARGLSGAVAGRLPTGEGKSGYKKPGRYKAAGERLGPNGSVREGC